MALKVQCDRCGESASADMIGHSAEYPNGWAKLELTHRAGRTFACWLCPGCAKDVERGAMEAPPRPSPKAFA